MKKFLAYSFLLIAVFGLTTSQSVVYAQQKWNEKGVSAESDRGKVVSRLIDAKKAGYYNQTGAIVSNYADSPGNTKDFSGKIQTTYYKTDGNLVFQYHAGTRGVVDATEADLMQAADDRIVSAFYKDSVGNVVEIIAPNTFAQGVGFSGTIANDNQFAYSVAQRFGFTGGATTATAYDKYLSTSANTVSFGSAESVRDKAQTFTQNGSVIRGLESDIAALEKEIAGMEDGSEKTQKEEELAVKKSELARVKNQSFDANKDVRAAASAGDSKVAAGSVAPGAASYAGFTNCSAVLTNSFTGQDPSYFFAGCSAAIVNLGIEVASTPFVIAAGLLDNVTVFTLEKFGDYVSKKNKKGEEGKLYKPINDVWQFFKNICNLFFIAALIWIAVKTILDAEGFQEAKRLRNVIIFAILINFSMFFTKLLIDVSNTASVQVYNVLLKSAANQTGKGNVVGIGEASSAQVSAFAVTVDEKSLSGIFLANLQVQKFLETNSTAKGIGFGNLSPGFIFMYGLLSIIFILVATVVIGTIALMLIVRFAVLVLLLMTSPIAYISTFTPSVIGSYGKMWWEKLKDNLIFLPVLMVMFYITMVFAKFASESISDPANANGYINLVFSYAITISMLVISISVAQAVGGSAAAASFGGKWARGIIGGGTVGLAARFGRRTAGGLSNAVANSDTIKKMALMRGPLGSIGRGVKSGAEKGAKATFDIRNTDVVPKGAMGDGLKGGRVDMVKENKELEEARIKARLEATKETAKEKIARELDTARNNNEGALTSAKQDIKDTNTKISETENEIEALKKALEKDATGSDLANLIAMQTKRLTEMQDEIDTTDKALQAAIKAGNGEQVIKMQKLKADQEKKRQAHAALGTDDLRKGYTDALENKNKAITSLNVAKGRAVQRVAKLTLDGVAVQSQIAKFEKESGKKIESAIRAAGVRQASANLDYLDYVSKGVMIPNIQRLFGVAGVKDVDKVRKEAFTKHVDEMFKSKDKKENEKMLKMISEMIEKGGGGGAPAATPAPAAKV